MDMDDEINNIVIRPLVSLLPRQTIRPIDEAFIDVWLSSQEFQVEKRFFQRYPAKSLLSDESRCFLYHAVKVMQPESVIEIGTYWAGTSEVIARALQENEKGALYTTDPYGADRCPRIISRWPQEMQQRIEFYALDSMAFMTVMRQREIVVDLAFIDGSHDYEYVLFDLLAVSRLMRPGGLLVLDNMEQAGVFFAAREFLRQNPGWREFGDVVAKARSDEPFAEPFKRGSIRHSNFLLISAPESLVLAPDGFFSTGQRRADYPSIKGIRLKILGGARSGILLLEACLRIFTTQVPPVEVKRVREIRIPQSDSPLSREIELQELERSPLSNAGGGTNRYTTEISLVWRPDDGHSTLRLAKEPTVYG